MRLQEAEERRLQAEERRLQREAEEGRRRQQAILKCWQEAEEDHQKALK